MHNNKYYIHNRGFTLIELLTVIAITTLLSLAGYAMFQNTQKNSRDQQRKSDLAKIHVSLGTYFLRLNQYPPEAGECDSSIGEITSNCCYIGTGCTFQTNWSTANSDLWQALITNTNILKKLPKDPINKWPYYYRFEQDSSNNQGNPICNQSSSTRACRYVLLALLENGEISGGGRGKCFFALRGGGGTNGDGARQYRWDDLDANAGTYNFPWCQGSEP